MASPTRALRSGISTLLTNAVSYTKKKGGTVNVKYFEQTPGPRTHFPIIRYKDCFLEPSDAKDCPGWDAVVTIETITSTAPGHGSFDPADEIESAIIALMTARPYTLSLGASYAIVSITFEDSAYDEGLVNPDPSRSIQKPQYVISKETDFRIIITEV